MTLQHFITLTARTPRTELRRAMTLALAEEVPRTPDGYARFHRRVVEELRLRQDQDTGARKIA